jgi:hypothetical protein
LTLTVGFGFTVTVKAAVPVQPFKVPVTVYVVVVVKMGVVGLETDTRPPVQLYELAPLAVKLAVSPRQILGLFTVIVGFGFTVTVETAVPVQPFVVPVTVYVVVVVKMGVVGVALADKPPVQL